MLRRSTLGGRGLIVAICITVTMLSLAGFVSWNSHLAVADTAPATSPAPDTIVGGNGVELDSLGCASGHFCIWTRPNFTGTLFQLRCDTTYFLNNFSGIDGSWDNNCSASTSEQLIKSDGAVILTTAGGGHILRHFDYTDIAKVHPV